MPTWADWFKAAGVNDADVSRGLHYAIELRAPGVGLRRITELLAETAAVVRRHWRVRRFAVDQPTITG